MTQLFLHCSHLAWPSKLAAPDYLFLIRQHRRGKIDIAPTQLNVIFWLNVLYGILKTSKLSALPSSRPLVTQSNTTVYLYVSTATSVLSTPALDPVHRATSSLDCDRIQNPCALNEKSGANTKRITQQIDLLCIKLW